MDAALQTELTLFADEHSAQIAALLRRSGQWLNASEILVRLSLDDTESHRRLVRKAAEELGCELISGQAGYRHIDAATPDEVLHFYRWMKSQGSKMLTRAQSALARKGLPKPD